MAGATQAETRWSRRSVGADIRLFSSGTDEVRARRPTDAVLLFVALLVIGVSALVADDPESAGGFLTTFVQGLPGLFGWFWETAHALLLLWAIALVLVALFARGRKFLVRDQLVAASLAVVLAWLDSWITTGQFQPLFEGVFRSAPPADFPAVQVCIATAVVACSSPHLSRPIRHFGRWIVTLGSLGAVALGVAYPGGIVTGFMIGIASAAVVHLIFGSPGGRPTTDHIRRALAEMGVEAAEVRIPALGRRGVVVAVARQEDGRELLVKVYGRDAWDGQLLASTWQSIWYRDEVPHITLNRLQQVEHEAFLTLLAERAGVPVTPVVAAGLAGARDALLVVDRTGRSILAGDPESVSDGVLDGLWAAVARLHGAGMVHGGLEADRLLVGDDGSVAIADFSTASVTPPAAQVQSDRTQLLVATALAVGVDRSVAAAARALGADGLQVMLPYVQPAALTVWMRQQLDDQVWDMGDLRRAAAAAAGTEAPGLQQIRRVTWGSVAQTVLLSVAAYFLITGIAGLGLSSIVDELRDADWAILLVALLISPLIQFAQAFSTRGASPRPLEYTPVLLLQFAIQFIALAIPSSAARIAMNIRFFQSVGVGGTTAVAVGAIDSFANFVVQVLLLLLIGIAGTSELSLSMSGVDASGFARGVLIVGVVAGIGLIVVLTVPRLRRLARSKLSMFIEPMRGLRDPSRLTQLLAGNAGAQIVSAIVLGSCLRAFGYSIGLGELIVINTLTSLLAGLLPIPGGIGVAEGALTYGLVAAGIPEAAAFATALTTRFITFYLPPLWGWFAMRQLRRTGYL